MSSLDIAALADRILIRELIEGYSNAVTRRDCGELKEMFVEDCIWQTKGTHPREFRGRDEVVNAISSVVNAYPLIFQMPHATRIAVDGATASATTLLHEIGKIDDLKGAFVVAVYSDRLVRTSEGWKFKERLFEALHHEDVSMAGTRKA